MSLLASCALTPPFSLLLPPPPSLTWGVREQERRELGEDTDIFLLQVSGRQVVHAYQMPRVRVQLEGHEQEQVLDPHGSPPESGGNEEVVWVPGGGGVERGGRQAAVEGMVLGDEIDDRCRKRALLT